MTENENVDFPFVLKNQSLKVLCTKPLDDLLCLQILFSSMKTGGKGIAIFRADIIVNVENTAPSVLTNLIQSWETQSNSQILWLVHIPSIKTAFSLWVPDPINPYIQQTLKSNQANLASCEVMTWVMSY